jgi:diketogulonate reductase-like aldo/keto reductase
MPALYCILFFFSGVIPKAIKPEHIKDNIKLDFEITEDQMKLLLNLCQIKYTWNPDNVV